MTQRFFRVRAEEYEQWRIWLEDQRGRPTLEPLQDVQRAEDGDVLIGVWAFHCDAPDTATAIAAMLSGGWGSEITEAEYRAAMPQPELP